MSIFDLLYGVYNANKMYTHVMHVLPLTVLKLMWSGSPGHCFDFFFKEKLLVFLLVLVDIGKFVCHIYNQVGMVIPSVGQGIGKFK